MKRIISIGFFIAAIILVAAIGSGYWWFMRPTVTALGPTPLLASGTIEADTVAITAELGGRILDLKVDEGDEVTTGQVLVELDKGDLLAQQIQLAAALAMAKANLALVSAPARAEEITAAQAQLAQAEVAREGARVIWQKAKALANNPHELAARINQARTRVSEAESNLELAQVNLKRMEIQAEAAGRNQSDNVALAQNEAAHYQLQAARAGVEMAEVALAGAKRQVEHLVRLRSMPLPLLAQANAAEAAYRQAEAAVLAAEANLSAVGADPTPEDIGLAKAQVLEAETILAAVEVQLAKQTLTAPREGLISQKLVEVGELAAPGAILLELKDLDTVELTVYIPEKRIGQVKIGQKALVYVDAYAGESFAGVVSFIAHEAEFTPRNVQTQAERVNLIFAVKIKLANPDHRLKPGMPADAEILLASWPNGPDEEPGAGNAHSPAWPQATMTPTVIPIIARPTNLPPATSTPVKVEATPTLAPTPTLTEVTSLIQAEIIAWGLNVRSGPGINHPVVATLAKGDTVSVINIDLNTDWLQVQLPDSPQTGWISGKPAYVSINIEDGSNE